MWSSSSIFLLNLPLHVFGWVYFEMVRDVNVRLSIIAKIKKNIKNLNTTLNRFDLVDIYRKISTKVE